MRRTFCGVGALIVLALMIPAAGAQSVPAASAGEIDRMLLKVFPSDGPGAAVLVVQNNAVKLRKGYGLANLELGTPVDAGDVFRLCSISKQFTAVAILQLAGAGKLKLDDDFHAYVPDYATGGKKITLKQLMTNTSGVASVEDLSEWKKVWREELSVSQILDMTRNKPLDFEPGSDWKYSNSGYNLLGAVIEKVSGQSYGEYIQSHIFGPAGMSRSYYANDDRIMPGRVEGYVRQGKGWANGPYISMTQTYSAGALLSTVDDLWKWEQALRSGSLVDPALLTQAYTDVILPDGRAAHYGFGWELNKLGDHATVEHAGGLPGFCGYEIRIADAGIYIAILCNTNDPGEELRGLAQRVARMVLGEPANGPGVVKVLSPGDYVGSYLIHGDAKFVVTENGGKVIGQLGPGKKELVAVGVDEFSAGEMGFKFMRDSAHRVDRVVVKTDGPGPEVSWGRE